ncbi:relaxase/mobilization nuclease domain-containing protein [Campylobacter showae]|uniref:relaxase/mobilization nuclease domain-containing protein n=2 Tax=Campylobacter showae TaxID=204 RepID=UPI000F0763DF|nr:relaxase/mobilization nuclease domain-containing protein [Campylobacter showae]
MTKKQKLCMGCLSFEETDIDLDTKRKIIDEFETLLLGGYKERFNVLWVQHVDKARLELNFAIPKIDIESSMAFNPYYDKVDRPLIDTWQNYVNLKFGFTDPKDPAKAHMLQGSRKEIGVIKDYIELEKILTEKFINQEFSCRDDILKALRDSNIEVSRVGKDYISIKLPNTKKAKRFKRDMFSEDFRDFESLDKLRSKAEARATEFANTRNAKRDIKEERRVDAFPDRNCRTDGFSKNGTSKEIQGGEGGAETKLSPRDQELERLTRELNRQIQKRNKWLEIQVGRVPKRSRYFQNTIGDLDDSNDLGIDIRMEAISTKE